MESVMTKISFQFFLCLIWVATGWSQVSTNSTNNASVLKLNAGSSYVLDDKHLLEPGDRISFQVLEDRDPAQSLIVADSREMDIPYIGRVSVAGKTCKQLSAELKALLEKEFYFRATVIIGLDQVNKVRGKVYVVGQVHTQGPIPLQFDQPLTASKAILMAGGFGDFAKKTKVKIVRNHGDGTTETKEVNLEAVMEEGKANLDVVLEPEDFIMVPQKAVNF